MPHFTENNPPSKEEILSWWKNNSSESMEIEGEIMPVHLRDKTLAFITSASFYERCRNCISNTILIRPELREVRLIELGSEVSIHDLNHDGISEVVLVGIGSGGGTTEYRKSLIQFKGWKPVVLRSVDYGNNDGVCADPPEPEAGLRECVSSDVEWKFEDLNGDGFQELVEVITKKRGHKSKIQYTKYFVFDGTHVTHLVEQNPSDVIKH